MATFRIGLDGKKRDSTMSKRTMISTKGIKQKIVFALLMGIITTGLISLTVIFVNVGILETFWETWLRSWLSAYLVVVPLILIVAPVIERIVDRVFEKRDGFQELD